MADAATTSERSTLSMGPITRITSHPVKGSTKLLKGTIAMIDATGYAIAGAEATTLTPGGRVRSTVDNTAGADAALYVELEEGIFKFTNAESANNIALAEEGLPAYVMNNQTVTQTSTGRSKLGKIFKYESDGVYVQVEKGIV